MRSLLFAFLFILLTPSSFAALPGQINLKYGYQMYVLPTQDKNLWGEFEKTYFQGEEILLSENELSKIPKDFIEYKKVQGINRAYLAHFLQQYIAPKIYQEAQSAELTLNNGRIEFSREIKEGRTLNTPLSVKIIEYALHNNIDEVELAVETQSPLLDVHKDVKELGIKELIAVGESDFSGSSPDRIHNIKTAMQRFQGYILAPGESFSFNTLLGKVDGSTGYKKELVIKGNDTIPEWGGGVCQVSSTLYRGAMLAGLPILERANHSYSVSYYSPAGSDATIYPGSHDLQFKNNTNTAITLQAYIEDTQLHFVVMGTKEKQEVSLYGPYITNTVKAPPTRYVPSKTLSPGEKYLVSHAHNGFQSTWFRSINGSSEKFFSLYEPRPRVYKVGGLTEVKVGTLD